MTNKERVMTILWLEAGMYRSETVAKKFGMSVSQLEAEAAEEAARIRLLHRPMLIPEARM